MHNKTDYNRKILENAAVFTIVIQNFPTKIALLVDWGVYLPSMAHRWYDILRKWVTSLKVIPNYKDLWAKKGRGLGKLYQMYW